MKEKIKKAINEFENKNVKITITGIIESRFELEKCTHTIEFGILELMESDKKYIDIDLDDVEKVYFESSNDGYAILILILQQGLEIEVEVIGVNSTPIIQKIRAEMDKIRIIDELLKKETCMV